MIMVRTPLIKVVIALASKFFKLPKEFAKFTQNCVRCFYFLRQSCVRVRSIAELVLVVGLFKIA